MDGVDEDESGVQVLGSPTSQGGKIAEVPDAPGLCRAHLIELRHQAGDPTMSHRWRQGQVLGRDDQCGPLRAFVQRGPIVLRGQFMPTRWQVAGELEGGLTDGLAVDGSRWHPPVDLGGPTAAAVLEVNP